jgi:K+-sensing histidine kinase KdpD
MDNTARLSETSGAGALSFDKEREHIHRRLLSAVMHDLKTPLVSIIGSLEIHTMMGQKLSDEKRAQLLQVALLEAYRLDSFITNILDMAKLEDGVIKPKRETVDIGVLLKNCMNRMKHQLRDSAVDIETASGTVQAMTDPALLSRAIELVLDNAIKYGGKPPVINIEFGRNASGYIRIRDNGGGIAQDQLEAIFSKYVRFGETESKHMASTGLGLAITRALMQLLGGDIVAANHESGGAVFILRFPLA